MQTLTGPPLIETKLRPPDRRAGFVPRPDLVARLEAEVAAHRLTVVSAAAGWGKTTLVARLAGGARTRPGLGGARRLADNDPARFWRYVAEALGRAGIALDAQAVGALSGADATREAGLTELINAVAEAEGADGAGARRLPRCRRALDRTRRWRSWCRACRTACGWW